MNVFNLEAWLGLNTTDYDKGLQNAEASAQNFGKGSALKSVAKVGAVALAAAGTALTVFGKKAVATGQEFDSSMSQVAATLGYTTEDIKNNVNGAGESFDALRAKAQEMGAATNFTASQAAEGLNILAMSGYNAEQSIGMIEDVLHLAAAGSMDMASAAGFISGSMKGFNDATKDSGYYADLMAKGATLANTSVSQLGEAMSSGAAGAAAYNQSAQSMTVSLLRLAEQGVTGTAAGTALRAAMKDLYTPTDKAAIALKTLGVSAYDAEGNARDFNEVVDELEASMEGMTDEQKNSYKQTIFGIQGLNAYNKMVVTGIDKQNQWNESLAAASDGAGEAAKQYDTMTDNLQGDLDIMHSAMDGFKIAVSDKLMPSIRDFVKFGSESISKFTEAFQTGGLDGLAGAVGDALSALLKKVSQKLPQFVKAGTSLLKSFLKGIINMLPDLAKAGIDIVVDLADSIAENLPELAVQAANAIVAIIQGLVDNAGKLIEGAAKVFGAIGKALIKAAPIIVKEIPNLVKTLWQALVDNFDSLMPIVGVMAGKAILGGIATGLGNSGLISQIKSVLTGSGGVITAVVGGIVLLGIATQKYFDDTYNAAKEEASKLSGPQQEIVDRIKDEIGKWDELKEKRKDLAKGVDEQVGKYKELWDRLQELVDAQGKVKEGHEEEVKQITGELSEALGIEIDLVDGQIQGYDKLKDSIDETIAKKKAELMLAAFEDDYTEAIKRRKQARQDLNAAEAGLKDAEKEQAQYAQELAAAQDRLNQAMAYGPGYTTLFGKSMGQLEADVAAAQGNFDGATEKIETFQSAINDANEILGQSEQTISNYNQATEAVAKGGVQEMTDATIIMSESLATAQNADKETLAKQVEQYYQAWEDQKEIADESGSELEKMQAQHCKDVLDVTIRELGKVEPAVAKELNEAIAAGKKLKPNWLNLGENIPKGIASGINSATHYIKEATTNALNAGLRAAKEHALIQSPSRLFEKEVGLMLGRGVAVGIEDAEDLVSSASENLIDAALPDDNYETEYSVIDTSDSDRLAGNVVINVYGAAGQDINALADEIALRFQRMYVRGTRKYA